MLARDIEMFIEHCGLKGLSTKTINSYEQTLRLFMQYMDEQGILLTEKITHLAIQGYIKSIKERGKYTVTTNPNSGNYPDRRVDFGKRVSDVTINNYLRNLRVFFNWCVEEELILRSPVKKGDFVKVERRPLEFVSDEDFKRLLKSMNELVRHRIASFAQESTRYCNYSKEKFEGSITVVEPFYIDKEQNRLFYRKWVESCELAEKTYFLMLMNGYRPEQARCVLPLCLKTEIVVTANFREWRNIFKLRTPVAAHPQMRELMCPLLKELQSKIPVVFDDIYTYWPKDEQTRKESVEK